MKPDGRRSRAVGPRILNFFKRFAWDRRANVAALMALLLIPLLGALGMAGEVSSWFMLNRAMQNAADSAAVAAATNGDTAFDTTGTVYRYQQEAYAAAAKYGYVNGVNNVTVTASGPSTVTCPSGSGTCFQVTISKPVPLYLVRIVGVNGNATLSGSPAQTIAATAIARAQGASPPFCILALGGTGLTQDLTVNGGPNSNMNGCAVVSNDNANCNGHPIGGSSGSYAVGTSNDCAANGNDVKLSSTVSDPYSGVFNSDTTPGPASDLSKCLNSFGSESKKTQLKWSAAPGTWSSSTDNVVCGDLQLTGNVTLPAGVLVIENGMLDMNGHNLAATSGTTIVFSGTTSSTASHIVTDNSKPGNVSVLTVSAPTSGVWSGMAIYQDPSLTSNVDMTSAGVGPSWFINGIVYGPHSQMTISGVIDGVGNQCIGFVVETLKINGTGDIIDTSGCSPISLQGVGATRVALVK